MNGSSDLFIPCYEVCLGQLVFLCWCQVFVFHSSPLQTIQQPQWFVGAVVQDEGAACLCCHRGTVTHQGLLDQASQLAICIKNFHYHTHMCVYRKTLWFLYIYMCIHTFFLFTEKNVILEHFSLECSYDFSLGKVMV